MKKHFKKVTSVIIAMALTVSMLPISDAGKQVSAASVTLQNPRIVADGSMESGQKVTWDCIWFGSYPQAEVIPSGIYTALDSSLLEDGDTIVSDDLYSKLQSATGWNANGDITIDGNKYRRINKADATYATSEVEWYYNWSDSTTYHYFKYEPIKWRVLNVNGNDAFLLADKGLDDQKYNTSYTSETWETSTIRSWLNGYSASSNVYGTDYSNKNFIDTAFSTSEQTAINTTTVINDDNLYYGTEGGNNTSDKVFLMSESEVYTESAASYGFVSSYGTYDEARRSKSSAYAKAMGTWSSTSTDYRGNCYWWLRSPGNDTYNASSVLDGGYVNRLGSSVDNIDSAIRPALHFNLSSSNLYSYAGTVCSDGMVYKEEESTTIVTPPTDETQNDTEETTKSQSSTTANTNNTTKPQNNVTKNNINNVTKESNVIKNSKTTKIKKLVAKKKSLKVTWNKKKGVNGYQLQYSTSKKFKKAKKITIKKAKTTSKTIKKLKAKKKYYIRIRTYITVKGKKYYSKWSKAKSQKTK